MESLANDSKLTCTRSDAHRKKGRVKRRFAIGYVVQRSGSQSTVLDLETISLLAPKQPTISRLKKCQSNHADTVQTASHMLAVFEVLRDHNSTKAAAVES